MSPHRASENNQDPAAVETDLLPPAENVDEPLSLEAPIHRVTGEHPAIRATSTDADTLTPIQPSSQETPTDLQDTEPEDTLPDVLDQQR